MQPRTNPNRGKTNRTRQTRHRRTIPRLDTTKQPRRNRNQLHRQPNKPNGANRDPTQKRAEKGLLSPKRQTQILFFQSPKHRVERQNHLQLFQLLSFTQISVLGKKEPVQKRRPKLFEFHIKKCHKPSLIPPKQRTINIIHIRVRQIISYNVAPNVQVTPILKRLM